MLIKSRNLIGLAVITRLGMRLGKVSGFEMDAESHLIRAYEVKRPLLGGTLLVPQQSVISITKEKMVVEDGVVPVGTPALASMPNA